MNSNRAAIAVLMFLLFVFFSGSVFSILSVAHVQQPDMIMLNKMIVKGNGQPKPAVPQQGLFDSYTNEVDALYTRN